METERMDINQQAVFNRNIEAIKKAHFHNYTSGITPSEFNELLKVWKELNPSDTRQYSYSCTACMLDLLKRFGQKYL